MKVWRVSAFCFPHHEVEHLQYVQEDAIYLGPMVSKTSLPPKTYRSAEDKHCFSRIMGAQGRGISPSRWFGLACRDLGGCSRKHLGLMGQERRPQVMPSHQGKGSDLWLECKIHQKRRLEPACGELEVS